MFSTYIDKVLVDSCSFFPERTERRSIRSISSLCDSCVRLAIFISSAQLPSLAPYPFMNNAPDLATSSLTCHLCAKLLRVFIDLKPRGVKERRRGKPNAKVMQRIWKYYTRSRQLKASLKGGNDYPQNTTLDTSKAVGVVFNLEDPNVERYRPANPETALVEEGRWSGVLASSVQFSLRTSKGG